MRRRLRQRNASALALVAAAIAAPVSAQVGQVAPPTRSQVERAPAPERTVPPSRLTISGGIERAPCPLADERFAAVSVTLDRVVFDDLTVVDPAVLAPASQPYLGHPVPIATVCDIRDAAATIMRRLGYLVAVQVPAQRIEGGTLHLSVLTARLVAVQVRGDVGHAERKIAGYLGRLATGAPFNSRAAERALLLAGDLPGFEINLTLRPAGTVPGEVVGDVTVTRIPYAVDFNVQNYGSRAIGRWSGLVNVEADDLLGLGDRATLSAYDTADFHEQTVVQGSYEIRPGSSGVVLSVRGTLARTRPDTGGGNPIEARTRIATAEAAHPLILHQPLKLRIAGGLDIVSQRLRFGGLPFTDDQLRVAYMRARTSRCSSRSRSPRALARPSRAGTPRSRWSCARASPRWARAAIAGRRRSMRAARSRRRSAASMPIRRRPWRGSAAAPAMR